MIEQKHVEFLEYMYKYICKEHKIYALVTTSLYITSKSISYVFFEIGGHI